MWKTIATAILLQPTDLCPNASHEPLHENCRLRWGSKSRDWFKQQTLLGRFLAFFSQLIGNVKWLRFPWPSSAKEETVFFAFSKNQCDSLLPIANELAQRKIPLRMHDVAVDLNPSNGGSQLAFPFEGGLKSLAAWGQLLSLLFFPCLIIQLLLARGYKKKSYSWALDEYWHAYGLYFVCSLWVRAAKPSTVVLSNDHTLFPCCMDRAARDQGVPTFYIQHACVTERFPPLRVTYALLDGRDALNKYIGAGTTETKAFLVGMPKYDPFANQTNSNKTLRHLGICLSKADQVEKFGELMRELLASSLDLTITVRPHPATNSRLLEEIKSHIGDIAISGPAEKAFEFLAKQDAIIAGVSSITLEAALLNVTPIHFPFNDTNSDWYGFVPKGLCQSFDSPKTLLPYLENLFEDRAVATDVAAYYCETVGTPYHGHTCELAADLIQSVANQLPLDISKWYRLEQGDKVTAYGLVDQR